MTALEAAQKLAINNRTPAEPPVATVARGLIRPGTNALTAQISPQGSLALTGGIRIPSAIKTDTYTATGLDCYLAFNIEGAETLNLPPIATSRGQVLFITNDTESGGSLTVDGDGSDTISFGGTSALTLAVTAGSSLLLVENDGAWHVFLHIVGP